MVLPINHFPDPVCVKFVDHEVDHKPSHSIYGIMDFGSVKLELNIKPSTIGRAVRLKIRLVLLFRPITPVNFFSVCYYCRLGYL